MSSRGEGKMAQLLFLVVTDTDKTHQVIDAWLKAGASGVMLLDVRGLAHWAHLFGARDDMPIIPSLDDIVQQREEPYHALLDVVPDDFDLKHLVQVTEAITGPLSDPNTGLLFALPVSHLWGRHRSGQKPVF